jgi:hypothetical protein
MYKDTLLADLIFINYSIADYNTRYTSSSYAVICNLSDDLRNRLNVPCGHRGQLALLVHGNQMGHQINASYHAFHYGVPSTSSEPSTLLSPSLPLLRTST